MDANDIRQHIETILDQHAAVFQAIREAGEAFDTAVVGLRRTLDAIHSANQEAAITAAIQANQAALRLLRDLPDTKERESRGCAFDAGSEHSAHLRRREIGHPASDWTNGFANL